ncbi:MAG: hypothetical protein ABII71_01365 [Candidatus Micrarchaeota archaeon]
MFGTSGIRGLYGKEVNEGLAIKVANAFSEKDIAIGRDTRKTGIPLSMAAASGALAAGRDVILLGIVPTPTVALATRKHSCNGIMVTASHNPGEYNGMKLISQSKEIDREYERKISERCSRNPILAEWDKVGKTTEDNGTIKNHIDLVLERVDSQAIMRAKPKVVVDCNGAGAVITPMLMRDLGCDVSVMNDSLEGFARPSEPNEKNLQGLIERMRSEKADFGLAHDGDADRVVIVDDSGSVLPLDVQLAMMIEHELENSRNRKIISTMEASLAVREVVEQNEGSIIITPVGSTYVAESLEKENALFGGEPCGEYIYKKGVHVPDAILAAAKFAELFCAKGRFSEQKKKYRQYFMAREKFRAANKYDAVGKIKKEITIEGRRSEEDGIRVDEDDGWFLIRASGTEPIVRLTMEYKTAKRLEGRKAQLVEAIKRSL